MKVSSRSFVSTETQATPEKGARMDNGTVSPTRQARAGSGRETPI